MHENATNISCLQSVQRTRAKKTFFQISTLEKGCHGSLNDRAPEAVLALKPFIVDLTEEVKMLIDQTPQLGCTRITWLVQYGQFGTRGNHEENALSGSQVGNRKARSPSVPSMVDRPMATAWKYTRLYMYYRTHMMLQRLLLATGGCKPLESQ